MLFATIISSLVFASCENSEINGKEAIKITSSTSVEVGLYAGEFDITYEILGVADESANVTPRVAHARLQ